MVEVRELEKSYRTDRGMVRAVQRLSFSMSPGEFLTLLGPSGCGKTTTLRCVAGLEIPDRGEVRIDETPVFSSSKGIMVPIERRDIGMVFQSYAIWPHMSVFENVAFPLKTRKGFSRKEIRTRVEECLRLVQMDEFIFRPATQLSGGQQQRVALARALIKEPKLLLLDEPLSNLDAKLREEMRLEIKELAKRLGMTMLYVTHDQVEALAMSDRILVMRDGAILQQGSPTEIYTSPQSQFVASFIGAANFLEGQVLDHTSDLARVQTRSGILTCLLSRGVRDGAKVLVSIRPEELCVLKQLPPETGNVLSGKITTLTFLGDSLDCRIQVDSQAFRAKLHPDEVYREGDSVFVQLPPQKALTIPWD